MITDANSAIWRTDLLEGVHQPGDEYRLALISSRQSSDFGALTEFYSEGLSGDECPESGGYVQGGIVLEGRTVSTDQSGGASLGFSPARWPDSTISASGAILYNATRGGRVLAVFNLRDAAGNPGAFSSVNGDFTVSIPSGGAGVLRIA